MTRSASVLARCAAVALVVLVAGSMARAQSSPARLGAALSVVSDGCQPWEDRPIEIAGSGILAGTAGVTDPGDDLGPEDGVVRTYDTVTVRLSYNVLDAPAQGLLVTASLDPELAWEDGEEERLDFVGCPGGATVDETRRTLVCAIGAVAVPPAVTGFIDVVVRVRGSAPNGSHPVMTVVVTADNGRPDPDPARCPQPVAGGCLASYAATRVSAALALETAKPDRWVASTTRDDVPGWEVAWNLEVLAGGDGDPRGDSRPRPDPIALHDWWRATTAAGSPVDLGGVIVGCSGQEGTWACAQPGGAGTTVEVTVSNIDPDEWVPTWTGQRSVDYRRQARVGRTVLTVFFPQAPIVAAGGPVTIRNCFATEPGDESAAEFAPRGLGGEPNLGGLDEPLGNNCAEIVLPIAAAPGRPEPSVKKYYWPAPHPSGLGEVVAGQAVEAWVEFENLAWAGSFISLDDVVVCDAFDNDTQELVQGWDNSTKTMRPAWAATTVNGNSLDASEVAVEFAAGPWGSWTAADTTRGRAWYAQSHAKCDDRIPVNPAGWVTEADVDFTNQGAARLDARDVNLVRARFREPVPPTARRFLRTNLRVRDNPIGTWVVNYASGRTSTPPYDFWLTGDCWEAHDGACPDVPVLGPDWKLGACGDVRIVVEAATYLYKGVGPFEWIPSGRMRRNSVVQAAGASERFELTVSVEHPSGSDTGVVARSVVVTDVLPVGMTFVDGSGVRRGEDRDGDGALDPGEDANGNGRLDPDAAAAPRILVDVPVPGAATLIWSVGDVVSSRKPMSVVIEYDARISVVVPGGRELVNRAEVGALGEPPADCQDLTETTRCRKATVKVVNTSTAGVEKDAVKELLASDDAAHFRLRFANLTDRPIEWMDAVDLLPWTSDPREPASSVRAPWAAITATVQALTAPIAVWVSTRPPWTLDVAGGGELDGLMDPAIYGTPGAGLAGTDWPCLLDDVGTSACPSVPSVGAVTALRFWGQDPDPTASGSPAASFLPADGEARTIDLWLQPGESRPGDVFHNSWGARLEGLALPAFDAAVAVVPVTPLYLPYALREACKPQPLTVAIVLDTSSSMERPSGAGGTKMQAAVDASRLLVDALQAGGSGHTVVAIVGFNSRAWIALPATEDRSAVLRALTDLAATTSAGSRLDLGIAVGAEVLGSAPVNRRIMVFLTDGLPNGVPVGPGGTMEETVLAAAVEARDNGIVIHTIGYGTPDAPDVADRVSPALLAAISGPTGVSRIAPDPASLTAAFEAIAADLECPR